MLKRIIITLFLVAAGACAQPPATPTVEGPAAGKTLPQPDGKTAEPRANPGLATAGMGVRVLSWNISSDAFSREPLAFRALMRKAQPDLILLDEVAPSAGEQQIRDALAGLKPDTREDWYIDFGLSGGRQRGVIVSRMPLERLPEFSGLVPYPESESHRIHDGMVAAGQLRPGYSMDGGIPVNGVIVLAGEHRLLTVIFDLQCCGDDPGSWQEDRRRVEVREIRQRIRQVLERTRVDGIIVAGDFNLIHTGLPLLIMSGPYPPPYAGLIAAELYHSGSSKTWTWDGRGTPFPSRALDFMLYSPQTLKLQEGYVLDTEDLPLFELEQLGLQPNTSAGLSEHRPLVAEFVWY